MQEGPKGVLSLVWMWGCTQLRMSDPGEAEGMLGQNIAGFYFYTWFFRWVLFSLSPLMHTIVNINLKSFQNCLQNVC